MNNRAFKILLPLLFFYVIAYGQQVQSTRLDKIRVPLVDYTPFNYSIALHAALSGTPEVGYIEYCNNEIRAYFRHIVYTPNIAKSPTKFVRDITVADKKMTAGPLFSCFEPLVRMSDSCFFFSFFPDRSSVFSYDVLGRYVNGKISYMDRDGREFNGIKELIDFKFGSIDRFVESYLDFSEQALLDDYKRNGLYEYHSVNDAVSQLKRDPLFYLYSHPEDKDVVIHRFLDQLQTILPIAQKRERLAEEIKSLMNREEPLSLVEVLEQYRMSGPSVYLAGWKISPILELNFNADDYVRLVRGLRVRQAETMSAFMFLADVFRTDILKTGSGIMDDRSIVKFIEHYLLE